MIAVFHYCFHAVISVAKKESPVWLRPLYGARLSIEAPDRTYSSEDSPISRPGPLLLTAIPDADLLFQGFDLVDAISTSPQSIPGGLFSYIHVLFGPLSR